MDSVTKQAVSNRTKIFIFDLMMEHGNLSPADIAGVVNSLAVGVSGANNGRAQASEQTPAKTKARTAGRPKRQNLRTGASRGTYEKSVLAAFASLGGKNLQSKTLRSKAGGTTQQLRTTLNRLIESKQVTYSGERAGTRYSLR